MKFDIAKKDQPSCSAYAFADDILLREFGESVTAKDNVAQCFVAVADRQVLKFQVEIKNPMIGSKIEFIVDGIVRGVQRIKHRVERLEATFDTAIYASSRSLCRGKLIVVANSDFVNCPLGLAKVGTVEIRLSRQATSLDSPKATTTGPCQTKDYTALPQPWNSFGVTQDSHLDFIGRDLLTQCQRTSFKKLTTETPSGFALQAVFRFIYRTADGLKAAHVMQVDEQAGVSGCLLTDTNTDVSLDSEEPNTPAELDGHSRPTRNDVSNSGFLSAASKYNHQNVVSSVNGSGLSGATADTEELQVDSRKRKPDECVKAKVDTKSSKRHCQCSRQLLDGVSSAATIPPRNPTKEDVAKMQREAIGMHKALSAAKKRAAEARDSYLERISERTEEQRQWEKYHAEYEQSLSELAQANHEEEHYQTALFAMGQ